MARGWRQDKEWSDKFILEIQRIFGEVFFSLPSLADDQLRNTDLICLDMSGKRIGCRVRKKEYLYKYPFEFTMRSSRPRGTKTELQKIIEGWGDYFFYGFSNSTETGFLQWLIGDLHIFRKSKDIEALGITKVNFDQSSNFKSFKWGEMPPDFFVKISSIELLFTDVCDKCLYPKVIYNNDKMFWICPKCQTLYEYTYVYDAQKKHRPIP
jgi:hypothetical protein